MRIPMYRATTNVDSQPPKEVFQLHLKKVRPHNAVHAVPAITI